MMSSKLRNLIDAKHTLLKVLRMNKIIIYLSREPDSTLNDGVLDAEHAEKPPGTIIDSV